MALKAAESKPRPDRVTLYFCPPHADEYEAIGYTAADETRQLTLG